MKRIVRLTESDLTRIVRRVINETKSPSQYSDVLLPTNLVTQARNFPNRKYLEGQSVLGVTNNVWGNTNSEGNTQITVTGDKYSIDNEGKWVFNKQVTWVVFTTGRAKPNTWFNADGDTYVSKGDGTLAKATMTKFPITKQNSTEYFDASIIQ
jgi:hypothetical protein